MIWELRHIHKVALLLEVAGIARSTFYYHVKQMDKPDKYAVIKQEISVIYEENHKRVGYRRITMELHHRGHCINHKTVQRLMKQLGLFCRVRMKRYNSYRGDVGEIAPDLLQRNFQADRPNEKWATDMTEFSMFGQKLYLSPILDLYNREIVSYSISHHPRFSQTVDMLEKAFRWIPDNSNLILHSDQGWQYQMKPYQRMLASKGIRQSMSRKGNCLDNAVVENFFGIVKSELLYMQDFTSMEHFKQELTAYLNYYNNRRIKQKLNGMSPVQFRLHTIHVA